VLKEDILRRMDHAHNPYTSTGCQVVM